MKIISYFNWLIEYKNKKEKFIKTIFIIFILVLIGLARLFLEVIFHINLNGKWYSFDPDIVFVMSVFPIYLCFFLLMVFYLLLKLFKIKIDFKTLFLLFFIFQFFSLIIPFFDWIGFEFKIPWTLKPALNIGCCNINPFFEAKNIFEQIIILTPLLLFFTHPVLITMGIIITWLFGGIFFFRYLSKELKISFIKKILIIIIFFHIIYWPIYKYFFIFDQLFSKISGINYYNHYGYGFYFLILGIIGLIYFWNKVGLDEKN